MKVETQLQTAELTFIM